MMGLPRSGKSTVARKLSEALRAPIVNRDSIRLALHGQRYQELAEPMVRAVAVVMVRALFGAGHAAVVVDETSLRRGSRDLWRDPGWSTEVLEVPTPVEVCLGRARRDNDAEIQPVIERMYDSWEPLEDGELRFDVSSIDALGVVLTLNASVKGFDLKG